MSNGGDHASPSAARGGRLDIAVVTETYLPEVNGVAMTMGRIVEGLAARGHRVQLVRPRQNGSDRPSTRPDLEELLQRGVPLPRYAGLKMGLPAGGSLTRAWRLHRPDVVHIVTEGPLGWSALAAARRLGVSVTSDFHTNFHVYSQHYGFGWLKRPILGYLRRFHNRTACTMVPTDAMRRDLQGEGFANLEVVARGVDTQLFDSRRRSEKLRRAWGAGPDDPVVIHVGRIAPEKNIGLVLSAFAAIRSRERNARLVLVGDGPQRAELQASSPHAVFAGMRTGEDLAAHYASGDMFLFASLTETYGNVTMEALASGLAVVAYDYAAAAEHIAHGVNGRLAPVGDAQAFMGQAVQSLDDCRPGSVMRRAARAAAESVSWDRIFDQFEGSLQRAMGANGRRPDARP